MATPVPDIKSPYSHLLADLRVVRNRLAKSKRLLKEAREALSNLVGEDQGTLEARQIREQQEEQALSDIDQDELEREALEQLIDTLRKDRMLAMTPVHTPANANACMAQPRIMPGEVQPHRPRTTPPQAVAPGQGPWWSRLLAWSAPRPRGQAEAPTYPCSEAGVERAEVPYTRYRQELPSAVERYAINGRDSTSVALDAFYDNDEHPDAVGERYEQVQEIRHSDLEDATTNTENQGAPAYDRNPHRPMAQPLYRKETNSRPRMTSEVPGGNIPREDPVGPIHRGPEVQSKAIRDRVHLKNQGEHDRVPNMKFELPELLEEEYLFGFLVQVDDTLIEHGWAKPSEKGIEYLCSTTLVNRLIKALSKCQVVHETAMHILQSQGYAKNWATIKESLCSIFCGREVLRSYLEERLAKLHLQSNEPRVVERYILAAQNTLSIYTSAYPDDQQSRTYKRQLIEGLPTQIRGTVKVQLRAALPGRDIEIAPMDSIAESIRSACDGLDSRQTFHKDRTKYAREEQKPQLNLPQTQGNQSRVNPRDFAKQFKSVFAVFPRQKALDQRNLKASDGFLQLTSKHGPWYVVGFRTERTIEQVQAILPEATIRAWRSDRRSDIANHVAIRVRAPPPALINCVHEADYGSVRMQMLPDSGTGLSYITIPANSVLQDHCLEGSCGTTQMANGTDVPVASYIDLNLLIQTIHGNQLGPFQMRFGVLNKQAEDLQLLMGRADMLKYKVDVTHSDGLKCVWDGQLVFDTSNIPVPSTDRTFAVRELETARPDLDAILGKLAKRDWCAVPGCEDFQVRLRPLEANEPEDPNTNQTHVWEVKVPQTETCGDNAYENMDYEKRLFQRLPSEGKTEHQKLVQKYCDSKFWWTTPKQEHSDYRKLPSAPVFLTFSGHDANNAKKARLVCDLRLANTAFNCTSNTPGVMDFIGKLRIAAPALLLTGDVEQAFYHVRLFKTLVQLRLGDGRVILSDRMTFGLAFGTATLDYVLKQLVAELNVSSDKCFLDTFVDDFVIGATPLGVEEALRLLQKFISLLSLTGFNCNPQKFGTMCTDSVKPMLCSSEIPVAVREIVKSQAESVSVVGTQFAYKAGLFMVTCETCKEVDLQLHTKKDYFKVAGILGFDPTGLHPERRELADAIRRIIGPENVHPREPKKGWNEPIRAEMAESAELKRIIEAVQRYLEKGMGGCDHGVPVNDDDVITLELCTDASNYGGGVHLCLSNSAGEKFDLVKSSWIWAEKHVNAHSNVKELRALLKGMRIVSNFLAPSSFLKNRVGGIRIACDNQAVVGWSKNLRRNTSECITRRSVLRLIDGINEEKIYLNEIAPTKIVHIKGEINVVADALSRDKVLLVQEPNSLKQGILMACQQSRKLSEVLEFFNSVHYVMSRFRGADEREWDSVVKNFWRVVQSGSKKPENNYYAIADGLIVAVDTGFDEQRIERIFIPHDAEPLIQLIIREKHIGCGHGSIDNTCARIREGYVIQKIKSKVSLYVRRCLVCQRLSAKRGKAITENITTKSRDKIPYEDAELDVLYVNKSWRILTVTCRTTGHTTWVTLDAEDSNGMLKAFFSATRIAGMPKMVYSDGASYFRSGTAKKFLPPGVIQAPYAPWEGGLHETLHRRGMQVMRALLQQRFQKVAPKKPLDRHWLLVQVALLLNTRPLSITTEAIVTPDTLAYGYTRQLDPADFSSRFGKRISSEEIRKKFAKLYMIQLRERSLGAFGQKNPVPVWKPKVGETVLVHVPTEGKESADWRLAKITDIYTRRLNVIRQGKTSTVNVSNVAPLYEGDVPETPGSIVMTSHHCGGHHHANFDDEDDDPCLAKEIAAAEKGRARYEKLKIQSDKFLMNLNIRTQRFRPRTVVSNEEHSDEDTHDSPIESLSAEVLIEECEPHDVQSVVRSFPPGVTTFVVVQPCDQTESDIVIEDLKNALKSIPATTSGCFRALRFKRPVCICGKCPSPESRAVGPFRSVAMLLKNISSVVAIRKGGLIGMWQNSESGTLSEFIRKYV